MGRRGLTGWSLISALCLLPTPAALGQSSEDDVPDDIDEGVEEVPVRRLDVVQNKSFVKAGRLELSTHAFALVTNNQFASRQLLFTGASAAYHVQEQLYLELSGQYYPYSLADLKGLTYALLELSGDSDNADPVVVPAENLYIALSAGFSPIYGKINLLAQRGQNFDVSFLVGAGLLQVQERSYRLGGYDESFQPIPEELPTGESPLLERYYAGHLGLASRFPVTGWLALKGEARFLGYAQMVEDYQAVPTVDPDGTVSYPERRAFGSAFIVTLGGSVFLPARASRP